MQPYTTNNTTNQQYQTHVPLTNQPPAHPPTPLQVPHPPYGQSPYPPLGQPSYSPHSQPFTPMKRCFICNNPGHLANRCPYKTRAPMPHANPITSRSPSDTQAASDTRVVSDMDTVSEANEVRDFADNLKKRKRPVQVSDFKTLACEIVKELQAQTEKAPVYPVDRRNHATSSPNKSLSHHGSRVRQRAPPAPSSNSKSICSKAANKHLTEVFRKSFKSFTVKELKASLDQAKITWNENDFKDHARKNTMIAKLAIFKSQENIDMMRDASAQ